MNGPCWFVNVVLVYAIRDRHTYVKRVVERQPRIEVMDNAATIEIMNKAGVEMKNNAGIKMKNNAGTEMKNMQAAK